MAGRPQFLLKPMIRHKWVPILVGFLVALLGKKNPKNYGEQPVPTRWVQALFLSRRRCRSVTNGSDYHSRCRRFPQLHHLKKSFGRPFFCGSKSQIFTKKTIFHDFGPDFGYFNFFVFEATMNFRFLGSHTELDLGTHHRGGVWVGVWRFDAT